MVKILFPFWQEEDREHYDLRFQRLDLRQDVYSRGDIKDEGAEDKIDRDDSVEMLLHVSLFMWVRSEWLLFITQKHVNRCKPKHPFLIHYPGPTGSDPAQVQQSYSCAARFRL